VKTARKRLDWWPGARALIALAALLAPSAGLSALAVSDSLNCPNRPTGWTPMVNRSFRSLAKGPADHQGSEGWDPFEARFARTTLNIVPEGTDGSALDVLYPAGFQGGTAPATAQMQLGSGSPPNEIYLCLRVRLDRNWQGHRSGTNKMFYLWVIGQPRVFVSAEGNGRGPLVPQFRLQGTPDPRRHLGPNLLPSTLVPRGVWTTWEMRFRMNSRGRADGIAQWWIDGRQTHDYRNMAFYGDRMLEPKDQWSLFQLRPIWGGGGDVVASPMHLWIDGVIIDGRSN
jgi:hypothetical protein